MTALESSYWQNQQSAISYGNEAPQELPRKMILQGTGSTGKSHRPTATSSLRLLPSKHTKGKIPPDLAVAFVIFGPFQLGLDFWISVPAVATAQREQNHPQPAVAPADCRKVTRDRQSRMTIPMLKSELARKRTSG